MSAGGESKSLILKASLTVDLVHGVAEAFTKARRDDPLHDLLERTFGKQDYRWYAIDMSGVVWAATYSSAANPELLYFNGRPARMARAEFTLCFHEADLVRPTRVRRRVCPHWVDKPS